MTHGTGSGYAYHGCRCTVCTEAQRARMRVYRKARTDTVTSDRPATNLGLKTSDPGDVGASRGLAPGR